MEISEYLATIESIHGAARRRQLSYLTAEDDALRGRSLRLHGRDLCSFASCSYLGLEQHPALVEGVVDAVRRYGTQFAYSRYYVASPSYRETEALLSELFGGHALITQSTSLGHQTVLPVIATEKDAIVMDNQAHLSIQAAVTLAQARGATVEVVRHFELDEKLLDTVQRLARKHRTVYFCGDGIYSMYGDCAPIGLLQQILDVAPNVRLYIDDAHGMSWAGQHGRGYFLSKMGLSERLVLATSLCKAFSAGGGCIVFADEAEREHVRHCGTPYYHSGPIQPPMLGAILASARLHLTDEIVTLQRTYQERVALMNQLMRAHDIPLLVDNESPIRFVRLGKTEAAHTLAERLMGEGYYVSTSTFPAVPLKRAGMRVAVTALNTPEEIRGFVQAMAHHIPRVLDEYGVDRAELDDLFQNALPRESRGAAAVGDVPARAAIAARRPAASPGVAREAGVQVEAYASIHEIDRAVWDGCMEGRGSSSWEALAMAERVFRGRVGREHNWAWRYFVARGADGRALGATYCTRVLVKDDMWMRPEVSAAAEERREDDPYFLTSEALMLGSPLSEGDHLGVADTAVATATREALIGALEAQAEAWNVETVVLRDFPAGDAVTDEWMHERDWIKVPILTNHTIEVGGTTEAEMVERAGRRTRRVLRGLIEASGRYQARVYGVNGEPLPDASWVPHLHQLYLSIAERKLRINDFRMPEELVGEMLACPSWEILALHLDPAAGGPEDGRPVAWGAMHRHGRHYTGFLCGVDRAFVAGRQDGAYRQLMLHATRRARELGMQTLHLGYDAELEKQRFGAHAQPTCFYVRARTHDEGTQMYELVTQVGLGAARVG